MKKFVKTLLIISTLGLLSSCVLVPSKKSFSSEPTQTTTSTQPTDTTTTTTSHELGDSCLFHTCGDYLPFDNYGIHISDEASGYENRDKIKNAINFEAGNDIISSLSASNCTILTDNGENDKSHFYLTIGTGSSGGSFQFTFATKITKVKIIVKPYYKSGYSIDTNATVYLDGEKHQIPNDGTNQPQASQTYEKTYSDPALSIKLSNTEGKQRFFLESVEVFFK